MLQVLSEGAYVDRMTVLDDLVSLLETGFVPDSNFVSAGFFTAITGHYQCCETREEQAKVLEVVSLLLHESSELMDEQCLYFLFQIASECDTSDVTGKNLLYFALYSIHSFFGHPLYKRIICDQIGLDKLLVYGGVADEIDAILMVVAIECAKSGKNIEFAKACLSFRKDSTAELTLVLLEYIASYDASILREPGILAYMFAMIDTYPRLVFDICVYLDENTITFMDNDKVDAAIHLAFRQRVEDGRTFVSALRALMRFVTISKARAENSVRTILPLLETESLPFSEKIVTVEFVSLCMRYLPHIIVEDIDSMASLFSDVFESGNAATIEKLTLGLEYLTRFMMEAPCGVGKLLDFLSSHNQIEFLEELAAGESSDISETAQEVLTLLQQSQC